MTATQLIQQLSQIMAQHGDQDLPVHTRAVFGGIQSLAPTAPEKVYFSMVSLPGQEFKPFIIIEHLS